MGKVFISPDPHQVPTTEKMFNLIFYGFAHLFRLSGQKIMLQNVVILWITTHYHVMVIVILKKQTRKAMLLACSLSFYYVGLLSYSFVYLDEA